MDEQLNKPDALDSDEATLQVMEEEIEAATPKAPVVVLPKHLKQSADALAAMIGFLGLNADVKAEAQGSKILLTVTSAEAGRIIGRKGQTLDAMQFILSRMLLKGEEIFPRLVIDIDGYARQGNVKEGHQRREGGSRDRSERPERNERDHFDRNDRGPRGRGKFAKGGRDRSDRSDSFSRDRVSPEREETLTQQALDYAKEVIKWGEPITLPPMNAMERRIIHIALQDNADVTTESIGDGARKSVVISQK